jgi:hypothetical protein
MFSNYIRQTVIDHIFRNQAFTPASTIYVALLTTMPTAADGTGLVEVSGGSYAREALPLSAAASDGSTSSSSNVTFPQATANWGTILGFAVYDAASGGNYMGSHRFEQQIPAASLEAVTLARGIASFANANVSSVVVKDSTEATTYTENTDYWIQYESGVIARNPAGSITASQVLHVQYNYPASQVINSGNRLQINSGDIGLVWKSYL